MPDESGAIWIPNNNFFPNRNGYNPSYIVLHGTGGGSSAQGTAEYFQSTQGTSNPVSSHYIVGTDGTVVQCVNESDGAWANGFISGQSGTSGDGYGNGFHDSWWDSGINPNLLTVSIEHVKSATDNSNALTPAQQQASFTLIQHICQRHNIPMRKADANGGITGHYAIDPVNRAECPGSYPCDELWTFSEGANTEVLDISQANNYFIDTGSTPDTRWHCKSTGFDIAYGILTYYRTCTATGLNGLSQFGLPLSSEVSAPGYKSVTIQHFERGIVAYDPQKEMDSVPGISGPCYPAHLDKFAWQSPPNQPQPPVVVPNTQSAISTIQSVLSALQPITPALQSVVKDLEPS